MLAQPYPVIGAEYTGVHPRLELRHLQEHPVQFSLFAQALNNIQDMRNTMDEDSPNYINRPNSWWQIAGIHGMPFVPWSGDPGASQEPNPNTTWEGYCYHSAAVFPIWHRLFVLLAEQALVNEAISIASELEASDPAAKDENWLRAATQLRFPFWDWTNPITAEQGIPQIFQDPTISIMTPGGSYNVVTNPLNHYRFPLKPGNAQNFGYMGNWNRTYRWVNNDENPTEERYDLALKAFSTGITIELRDLPTTLNPLSWLREKIAGLFTYDLTLEDPSYGPNMWGYFSNTGASSAGVDPPMPVMPSSIEETHNMVHVDTGGNGVMCTNEYAAFDPIFYLHHSNVDRIFSFWEYLYPDYWIENGWKSQAGEIIPFLNPRGTYGQAANASVDHATPLAPFRTKSLDYWTSDDIRSLLSTSPINKYYTYPAIKDPETGIEVKVDMPYDVNNLTLREQFQRTLYNEWSEDRYTVLQTHRNLSKAFPQHVRLLLHEENEFVHLRHFFVVGEVPESAFPGSYRLELYLPPKNPRQMTTVHVVNSITVLGRGNPDNHPAPRDRRNHVRGYMHLDSRLILYLITQLDPAQLAATTDLNNLVLLIQRSFGARLVKPDGTRLAAADPYVQGGGNAPPLEEAKVPRLTLHSRVVSFKHADAGAPIKFGQAETHGTFREGNEWKAF